MSLRYIPEEVSSRLINHELATRAAYRALVDAAEAPTSLFPPVLGHGQDSANRFSVKAATTATATGLKVGSYWRSNIGRGLPAHSSAILLLNPDSGRVDTFIEASRANGFRTAAANALAVEHLARPEASRLAIFGAGGQARFECAALRRVREINEVMVVGRGGDRAAMFVEELRAEGLSARCVDAEFACRNADIIVTVTGARAPLFSGSWIGPGVHVSSMGSDGPGKQELPPELLARAKLYCDLKAQSLQIGEFQHAAEAIRRGELKVTHIGDVLTRRSPGRTSPADITVFDSSGLALQDLHLALCLLEAMSEREKLMPTST